MKGGVGGEPCLRALARPLSLSEADTPSHPKKEEAFQGGRAEQPESKFLSHWELVSLVVIFSLFSSALVLIFFTMPKIDPAILRFPKTMEDLQDTRDHLSTYTKDYTAQVVLGYIATYIFMQTFMIPGTLFFSLLAGALFGVYYGLLLVLFSATAGASSCYYLSKLVGRPLVARMFPNKILFFRAEVAKRKHKLLNYMLFLRITPSLPNTFINLASPIVDIPYHIFLLATFFGLIPASIISVRAGLTLGELKSMGDLYNVNTLILLFMLGFLSIIPTFLNAPRRLSVD